MTLALIASSIAILLELSGTASAEPIVFQVPSGESASVDVSMDPNDLDDTAVHVRNLSSQTGQVSVEFVAGAQSGPTQGDFRLVDGTLVVHSDIPAGQIRVGYRIEFDREALIRVGSDPSSARMLRRTRTGWVRAVRAIRVGDPLPYALRDFDFTFPVGAHGRSPDKNYVWGILDVNSSYAVGALPFSVPALAPVLALGLGGILVGVGVARLRS